MIPLPPKSRPGWRSVVFAKDQPEYIPLPANLGPPYVETLWHLSWRERLRVLLRGEIYLLIKTFGRPLQPLRMTVKQDLEVQ